MKNSTLLLISLLCLFFVCCSKDQHQPETILIETDTTSLLPCAYLEDYELRTIINDDSKYGFSDLNGNIIVECKYDYAFPFENGFSLVRIGLHKGFINTCGKEIFPKEKYTLMNSFSEGFAAVEKNDK